MVPNVVWMLSSRSASTARVKVAEGYLYMGGQVGTVLRVGFEGNKQFYELRLGSGRSGKKVVVPSRFCKLFTLDGELWDKDGGDECGQVGAGVSCCPLVCSMSVAVCKSHTPEGGWGRQMRSSRSRG